MAAPTVVQSAIGSNGNSAATATRAATFAGSVTAGHWIVAAIRVGAQDADSGTVTDTRGNTYTLQQASVVSGTTRVAIFLAPSLSTGANTVTYALASGSAVLSLAVVEVAPAGGAIVVTHTSAGGSGTGTTFTGANLVTSVDTLMLAFAFGFNAFDTWSVTGGFTQIQTTAFASVTASLITKSAAAGTHTPGWTNSVSRAYEIASIALGTAASGVAVPDVVDDLQADAITAITGAGLTAGTITSGLSATVAAGHVISQSPLAGTLVALGTAVDLVVALGAPGLVVRIAGDVWTFRAGSMTIHSTLNGRDTLSGIIDILDGADPPTLHQEMTVEEDGVRIFGGKIETLEYRAITDDASQDLTVQLDAVDNNALLDNRTVAAFAAPEGLTLKQALELLMPELTSMGITLSPTQVDGPVLPALAYTLQAATAVLDELTKLTEFVWEVDYYKVLTMWSPGSVAAPFNIADGDGQVVGDIVITPLASDHANRIIHRSGPSAPEAFNDWWYTDGVTNAFYYHENVLWPHDMCLVDTPLEHPDNPYGGFETVGAPGEGKVWEFHDGPFGTQYLSRTEGPPPPGGAYAIPVPLQHKCHVQFPLIVTADDLADQAINGIIEKVVDHGPEILFRETAQAIADSLLIRHVSKRSIVRYSTRAPGLRVGQSQTITIGRRDLSGPYFITDVETRMIGATFLMYTITANAVSLHQGSWRDTYKLWAATSGGGGGGAGASGSSGGGEYPPPGTPMPHHAQHEPGGLDVMTVDSTASIGSLRTLGPGANQAAPGNDARFSTPALHHATHEPGGADVLQLTASARLFGRATSGAGAVEELTIGDNLFLSGTTLSATSRNSAFVAYSFSAVQAAPPGTNQIRFSAGYPYTAVTTVWMDLVTADGQDVYRGLLIVPTGSTLLVQDKNDHTQYAIFTTTGAPVDHTTYVAFPVVHQAHGNSIGGGQLVLVQNAGAPLGSASLTTQQKTRGLTVVFGTGSAVITAGLKTYVSCPYTGAITAARLLAVDAAVTSGSIVIDVWKDTYAAYPPVVGDSITASAKPTLSSATKSEDTTLTGWTTAVTAGDVFGFVVDSATTVRQVALQLTIVLS